MVIHIATKNEIIQSSNTALSNHRKRMLLKIVLWYLMVIVRSVRFKNGIEMVAF